MPQPRKDSLRSWIGVPRLGWLRRGTGGFPRQKPAADYCGEQQVDPATRMIRSL
jgi:hypothetical protein